MSNEVYRNFHNQNYIIYVALFFASVGVLCFYRFHFVTVGVSYVLGCVACYYGLNSSYLPQFICNLRCHLVEDIPEKKLVEISKGCVACGSKNCSRHDGRPLAEPWVGVQVHKQLDQAIEDFYNTILEQFINSWCSKITHQPFFVDELRHQLRYASACLLRRAVKINYSRFITERLVPCALRHYTLCAGLFEGAALLDSKLAVHPAAANRKAELKYLRSITNAIMPYLLKNAELDNSVFRILVREIFAGWVLLSLADVLADPFILNTLIVLATGDETIAPLPSTPNYNVEFLETFVRQTESVYMQRSKLFHLDLEFVINDQDHFYAFMQYLKTTSHIHLLQFYKDIKSFQTRILNPDLGEEEQASLYAEALDIYDRYLAPDSAGRLPLPNDLTDELSDLLKTGNDVKRLQTSRALYQAARQSHSVLEKNMLPRFLHSQEYYKLFIGSRIPTGYQKHMFKKPQERLVYHALKLGYRLKNALKPQTIDGQLLDGLSSSDVSEDENMDNMDILKYLESIAKQEESDHDLSTYKVVLTNVETRLQAPPRRGTVRVFTVAVHRVDGAEGARLWSLERSENDFHLLRSKLHEFHGDRLLHNLTLPSRRDNSPLENLRYKYEDFIQRLLQKSLLQTSELLHLFLTVDSDFSLVVQASTLNANSSDLTNIYQTVTHRLRKEKGQHLESFLRNLLVSSDIDRYQALKQGTAREVEEALEVSEDAEVEQMWVTRKNNARTIRGTIFENNFDVEPITLPTGNSHMQNTVVGFTQCLVFFLTKVCKIRGAVSGILGSLLGLGRATIDDVFNGWLNRTLCDLLSERRLAHLIRLGQAEIFGKKTSSQRPNRTQQCDLAREQLMNSIPAAVNCVAGPGLPFAVLRMFEIIQSPQLNKQLFYNLLDLCLLELFPELSPVDNTSKDSNS